MSFFIIDLFNILPEKVAGELKEKGRSEPGIIHISDEVKKMITGFRFSERGEVEVKGRMRTWYVAEPVKNS